MISSIDFLNVFDILYLARILTLQSPNRELLLVCCMAQSRCLLKKWLEKCEADREHSHRRLAMETLNSYNCGVIHLQLNVSISCLCDCSYA